MSKSISNDNDLTISYIKRQYDIMDQKATKLQIDNTKKDKEILSLQSELLIFKKSTNNTSSQFPLPSEFKKQWLNLVQTSLMDTFDTIYSNSLLLSIVVQKSFTIIYSQCKQLLHDKTIFILNCFGITEYNEESLQVFFVKFRKIIFQDYYKTLFACDESFIEKTIAMIKKNLFEEYKGEYVFNNRDKEDIMRDLNMLGMRKYIEEAFWLCLFMILHDPPLMLSCSEGLMYYYYAKSEFINIEGFAKDNSPCLLILYPPMIRANMVFNGIKATVYACETVTEEIIRQCDINKQNQPLKKKTSKSLSDGEEKYANNISFNQTGPDQLTEINYKTIEEGSHKPMTMPKNNRVKAEGNSNMKQQAEMLKTNKLNESINNVNDSLRNKTANAHCNSQQQQQKNHNQSTSFDEPVILKQNTTNNNNNNNNGNNQTKTISSYNNSTNINANMNSAAIRSKSVNKPYPNAIAKHAQKALMYNFKKKNDDKDSSLMNNTNTTTNHQQAQHHRNSLKETLLQTNITNKLTNLNTTNDNTKLNDHQVSSSLKPKSDIKQSNTKSPSPNHIIDKSRNGNNNINHIDTPSITKSNKFEVLKANDQPLITEIKQRTSLTSINYLKTPIPKRREITSITKENIGQLSSSRRDTSNNDTSEPIRYNTNMTNVLGINRTRDQDELSNSIYNNSKNSHYQTTIKRVSSGNSYLRKIISDTSNTFKANHHDSSKNNNDSFAGDKHHYNHSNSNPYLLRNNLQPDSNATYTGTGTASGIATGVDYTINRDSSCNTLLTNNSNSQCSTNQCATKKNNRNDHYNHHKNQFLSSNSHNESRGSIRHYNENDNTLNSKLEYNTNPINSKQTTNPTISFNIGKGINYMASQTVKTENYSNCNNTTLQSNKGNNSTRTVGNISNSGANGHISNNTGSNGNGSGLMITNDFKYNGLRRNDNIQKKGSLGCNSNNVSNSNKKKLDVQLNYDLTANQFQSINMNSPSCKVEKEKAKTSSQATIASYKNNSNKTVITPAVVNPICNDNTNNNSNCGTSSSNNQKTLTKAGTFDHSGGIENHFANTGNINSNTKQRKYNNISNKILNQLGVKAETYLGLKK